MQLPKLARILPNNMLFEISKIYRLSKLPTSMGRTPVNWLAERNKKIGQRPMTCVDIEPLRLLLARFKLNKFWHLLRLRGMLP